MTDTDTIKKTLAAAVKVAIEAVGLPTFKQTSLFMSNRKGT
jgi:hypothetical protein